MYQDIIRSKLAEQAEVLDRALAGDLSSVRYTAEHTPGQGTSDRNFINRLRFVFFLLFERVDQEALVKTLFEEELKDRETNSFQGIGKGLEALTLLLRRYNADGSCDALIERAKNANFDCCCGYNSDVDFPEDLSAYTLKDCIYLALELQYLDEARELVDLWRAGVTEWNASAWHTLAYFNDRVGRSAENEAPYQALLDFARQEGQAFQIASASQDLFRHYIQSARWPEALRTFQTLQSEIDFSLVERYNLMSFLLEDCMDFVSGCPEPARAVWDWAKPRLRKKSDNLYGRLYKKAIDVARRLDEPFSAEMAEAYAVWKQKVGFDA